MMNDAASSSVPSPAVVDQVLDGWLDDGKHVFPLKVQYEDTDLGGIVYHGQYLAFAERGRSAMLRCCGIDHNALRAENMAFAVRRADIAFKAPSRQSEMLKVMTSPSRIGGAVLHLHQQILGSSGDLRADLNVEVAVIHLDRGAMRLPAEIHDRIVAMMC